ncbi:uracil-DNA glycosylase [uncultured Enterococcus sp.]|uniref:uracil-DNA glycosylase n=1 Tax=uncultured Enterococcus sp. TaxID=167972 RepID=UPI0025D59A7C|nr:uracil-DNA glycosylase [uncultured Enterococcus sp.]
MKESDSMANNTWSDVLAPICQTTKMRELETFVDQAYQTTQVFPPRELIFEALHQTPYEAVKVVILGQDPYHNDHQANGLAFSVTKGQKIPPSLRNMYKEMQDDLHVTPPTHGDLHAWAKQGVLLLNTVLTVEAHQANSHQKKGWEQFTDAVIDALNQRQTPVVFVLWGGSAKKKSQRIDTQKHKIITAAHPSPLSAYRGFFGSRPFSTINDTLVKLGQTPIDWQIPD